MTAKKSRFLQTLKKDSFAVWVLATSSLCLGLLLNQFRDRPLPLVYQNKEERLLQTIQRVASDEKRTSNEVAPLPEYIDLDEFRAVIEEKRGRVFDARPEIFHRLGHVPGAISLPREDFEKAYSEMRETLEGDKSQFIAVYCSNSSCEDSDLVRKALLELGFTRVTVFKGGWSAWTSAGLPEETSS